MYKIVKGFCKIFFKLFYRVHLEGNIDLPETTGYMICCNHIHMFDPAILMIFNKRPITFVIKEELMHVPIVKNIMNGCGAIPVKRGESDISSIKNTIAALKDGKIVGLFPEGTRHPDGEFRDIKKGAAMIACKANVPILPVRIIGNYKPFSKITFKIGEPIYYEGKNKEELTNILYESIEKLK